MLRARRARRKKTQAKKTHEHLKKTNRQLKKTSCSLLLEEDPGEENPLFKPAESLHYQNGGDRKAGLLRSKP